MIAGYNHVVCANLMKAIAQKKRPAPFNLVKLFTLCKTSKLISGQLDDEDGHEAALQSMAYPRPYLLKPEENDSEQDMGSS